MNTLTKISINELMNRAADGDSAAINVLDMIDANESGALTASDEQLAIWYNAH